MKVLVLTTSYPRYEGDSTVNFLGEAVSCLRERGIEAFYKAGPSSGIAGIYGGPMMNPGGPAEIWVGEHDLERARQLLRELG